MATKKVVAKKTAVPTKKTVGEEGSAHQGSRPGRRHPAQKMTKTQLIRYMAEQMETSGQSQCAAFLAGLVELAITQTKKNGEFTIPGLASS